MNKKIILLDKKEKVELPCRIMMGALVRFKRETGRDISKLTDEDITDLLFFVYCCVAASCSADGVEFKYTFDRFADCLPPDGLSGFYADIKSQKKNLMGTVTTQDKRP